MSNNNYFFMNPTDNEWMTCECHSCMRIRESKLRMAKTQPRLMLVMTGVMAGFMAMMGAFALASGEGLAALAFLVPMALVMCAPLGIAALVTNHKSKKLIAEVNQARADVSKKNDEEWAAATREIEKLKHTRLQAA